MPTVCVGTGFDFGSLASPSCRGYGAADLCGATGTLVAMQDLACQGGELRLAECQWAGPTAACLSHDADSVVYCGRDDDLAGREGSARLLSQDGAPSLAGDGLLEVFVSGAWSPVCGVTAGAATVACKALGFSGAQAVVEKASGRAAPAVGELSCSGSEASILDCSYQIGEDV